VFPALEKTDRIHAQPGALGQVLPRKPRRVLVPPQEIAEVQMLFGVHYSLSLACMLSDARQHRTLPVRAP
jgi:hypothetical protein